MSNPYSVEGSLTICLMIRDELDIMFDSGTWNTPFYFFPESEEETAKLIELLELFELEYHRL